MCNLPLSASCFVELISIWFRLDSSIRLSCFSFLLHRTMFSLFTFKMCHKHFENSPYFFSQSIVFSLFFFYKVNVIIIQDSLRKTCSLPIEPPHLNAKTKILELVWDPFNAKIIDELWQPSQVHQEKHIIFKKRFQNFCGLRVEAAF